MATFKPIAVLSVDDARELLRAIGCDYTTLSLNRERSELIHTRSPEGWRIIDGLRKVVREHDERER